MKAIKSFLKFFVPLGVAGLLLWFVFKDLNLKEILMRLKTADYRWVFLSMFLALISHYLRACRWTLMLKPIGFNVKTNRAFLALMGGYIANLALPRLGEFTRCVILKRTESIPLSASFGSVIIERIIDLIMLAGVIVLAFFLQFDRILSFFSGFFLRSGSHSSVPVILWTIALAVVLVIVLLIFRKHRDTVYKSSIFKKIKPYLGELINGFTSIGKVENKTVFFILTFLIWILYYFMSYVILFSFPATSGMGLLAGIMILMAGGLGMSAPVQGGIGTYHIFVSSALLLYGINREDGVLYATLMHTTQLVFILVSGSLCLLISMVLVRKKNKNEQHPG